MNDPGQTFFQVYTYGPIADKTPAAGQIVCVTKLPYPYWDAQILLVTDGVKSISELFDHWKNTQVTSQEAMGGINNLQQQITALQQAANRALVFDSHAALSAWMSSGQPLPSPNPPYTPLDLQIGWLALFRSKGEADQWWDGSRWLDQEIRLDLSGYRTAEEEDKIFAPLVSPKFRGVPEVPTPDYKNPQQAVPVSDLAWLVNTVRDMLAGVRRRYRIYEKDRPLEKIRQYEKGLILRKAEDDIIKLDKPCCVCNNGVIAD